jgi:hypothetical protein
MTMLKNSRLLPVFLFAFLTQSALNLWWVYRPGVVNPLWFVGGNLVLGIPWIGCVCVAAVRLIRARRGKRKPQKTTD